VLSGRSVLVVTAVVVAFVGAGVPAYADPTNPVDCSQHPQAPGCTVQVGDPGSPGSGGGNGGGGGGSNVCHYPVTNKVVPCFVPEYGQFSADDGCYYRLATGVELAAAEAVGGPAVPPQHWYVGACGGYPPVGGVTKFRLFGGAALPDPAVLAARAVKDLRLPSPGIRVNPVPPVAQLVYLPSWLWLDPGSWGTRSATASVPGLSVTATATPSRLVFSTGDGASVTCVGPGTAWSSGMDPNSSSPSGCGHTYTRPGTYPLTATVTWQVGWAGGGQTGTVADLTTTATVQVTVTDSQALNTNPRG
jgi:hypothetical protein